jgi:hypothetical protein
MAAGSEVWLANDPVIAKRQTKSSSKGQSTAAIIVRLVNLRLASSNAAITRPPISRGSGVAKSTSSMTRATRPLMVWLRSWGWRGTSETSRVTAMTVSAMRSCQSSHTTPKTQTRPTTAGTPQTRRKVWKLRLPTWPMRMFCGLPMTVAAEPALLAPAKAMTKGLGSRPRLRAPAISSGVIVSTTMSLARSAVMPPHTATVMASSQAAPPRRPVIQSAQRS